MRARLSLHAKVYSRGRVEGRGYFLYPFESDWDIIYLIKKVYHMCTDMAYIQIPAGKPPKTNGARLPHQGPATAALAEA